MANDLEDVKFEDLDDGISVQEKNDVDVDKEEVSISPEEVDLDNPRQSSGNPVTQKSLGLPYNTSKVSNKPTNDKNISMTDPSTLISKDEMDRILDREIPTGTDFLKNAISTDFETLRKTPSENSTDPKIDAVKIAKEAGINNQFLDRPDRYQDEAYGYLGIDSIGLDGLAEWGVDTAEMTWNASTNVVEEATRLATAGLFGTAELSNDFSLNAGADNDFLADEETQQEVQDNIKNFFDSIEVSNEEELAPRGERVEAVKDVLREEHPEVSKKQRDIFARRLNREIENGRKSAVAWDNVGEEITEQGLKFVLPIATELKAFSTTMNATRFVPGAYSTLGRTGRTALATVTAGGAAGSVYEGTDQVFETLDSEDELGPDEKKAIEYDKIMKSAVQDGLLNLAIGVGAVGGAGAVKVAGKTMKGGINSIFDVSKNLDEVLSNTVPTDKIREISDKADEIKRLVEDGQTQEAIKSGKRLKELMLDEDIVDDVSKIGPRLKKTFRQMFGTEKGKQTERAFERLLEFRYSKKELSSLDPEEKLELDAYFWDLGKNPERKEEAVDMMAKSMDLDSMSDDELEEAFGEFNKTQDFFNPNIIKDLDDPSKLKEESPVMHRLFSKGTSKPEDMVLNSDQIEEGYRGRWEQLKNTFWGKNVGPQFLMAGKTAKDSDVPLDLAFLESTAGMKKTQVTYNNGIEGLPGAKEIDEFFRKNNMEIELNGDAHRQVTDVLRRVEYDTRKLTDEFLENNLRTDEQVETAKFVRDWFNKAADVFDLDPKRMIDNYLPRLPDMSGTTQARKALKGDAPVYNRFKQARDSHEAVDSADLSKDLQDMMKRYIHAGAYEKHAKPAMMNFEQQVNKLRSLNHPDAEHWGRWLQEMRGNVARKSEIGESMMNALAEKVKGVDNVVGTNLQRWFKEHRPGDIISSAVYKNYLWARQDFRIMNAGQTMHTLADVPTDSFEWANRQAFNNSDKLDNILSRSGVRGDADQFGEWQTFARSNEGKSRTGILGGMKKMAGKLFSFKNISESDAFNVRRSFAGGARKVHNGLDDLKNGNISFDEYVNRSQLDVLPEPTLNKVKDFVEEGKIGMMVDPDSGERYTLEQALELGEKDVSQLQVDIQSAEGTSAFSTTFMTQWEYGKGALGKMYWKGSDPSTNDGWRFTKDILQNSALPFTTWSIHYIHRLKKLAENPVKNADRLMKQATFSSMYAEQIQELFDIDASTFFAAGPIPREVLFSPPISTAMSAYTASALGGKLAFNPGADDDTRQIWERGLKENARKFAGNIWGEGTNVNRAGQLIQDSIGGSVQLLSGGAYKSRGNGPKEFIEDVVLGGVKLGDTTREDFIKAYDDLIDNTEPIDSDSRGDVRATGRGR